MEKNKYQDAPAGMPKWDKNNYRTWQEWAIDCYEAGVKSKFDVLSPATLEGEQFTKGDLELIKSFASEKISLYGNSGKTLVALVDGMDYEEKEANANRIVTAWNCHDDLVNALKPFKLLAQEVLDVKDRPQIVYAFNGAAITIQDLANVLKAMYKASPKTL